MLNSRFILRACKTVFLTKHEININYLLFQRYCNIGCKSEKEFEKDHPALQYVNTSHQYTAGKKATISQLQKLFDLTTFSASDIVSRYEVLCSVTCETISTNYSILKNEGVNDIIMLTYPAVLAEKGITSKIYILKKLKYPVEDTLPLLGLSTWKLASFVSMLLHDQTHLQRVAILFQATVAQACSFLVYRPFLINMPINKLEANVKALNDFDISLDKIKNDFWVLQYRTEVIIEKLKVAKELHVGDLKTWMIRSTPEILKNYIKRISVNKQVLGKNSLEEYLTKRLECSLYQTELILSKHPALLTKNVQKISDIIDCLIHEGFTPQHIVRNAKVLLHGIETTKKRLQEMKSQDLKVDSLHMLTKSQKQYMLYYDNVVKNSKSKIKETE